MDHPLTMPFILQNKPFFFLSLEGLLTHLVYVRNTYMYTCTVVHAERCLSYHRSNLLPITSRSTNLPTGGGTLSGGAATPGYCWPWTPPATWPGTSTTARRASCRCCCQSRRRRRAPTNHTAGGGGRRRTAGGFRWRPDASPSCTPRWLGTPTGSGLPLQWRPRACYTLLSSSSSSKK